jgi:hypothetical protein
MVPNLKKEAHMSKGVMWALKESFTALKENYSV